MQQELKERLEEILYKHLQLGKDTYIANQNNNVLNAMLEAHNLAMAEKWVSVEDRKPTEYGKYWVYRKGCNKQHSETWNNTGWAYNNNDITHWMPLPQPPIS